MPYLHWETDRQRETIARMIGEESEKQRLKLETSMSQAKIERQNQRLDLDKPNNPLHIEHQDTIDTGHLDLRPVDPTQKQEDTKKTAIRQPVSTVIDVVMSAWAPDSKKSKTVGWPLEFDKEDSGRLMARSKLGQFLLDAARLYEAMHAFRDKQLLEKFQYSDSGAPLHPRRTLDQSHYWTLKTTKARDRDQVVFRGTHANTDFLHRFREREPSKIRKNVVIESLGKLQAKINKKNLVEQTECWHWIGHTKTNEKHGCQQCANDIRKVSRIVMVDQLWMWILDEKTIITSFPRRYGTNKHDPSGIHKSIRTRLKESRRNQIRSVYDLALIILDECSNEFFDRTRTQARCHDKILLYLTLFPRPLCLLVSLSRTTSRKSWISSPRPLAML
jgi:hypothetical protein